MKRFQCASTVVAILFCGIASCGKYEPHAALKRLEAGSPVVHSKLNVSDCKLGSLVLDSNSPIQLRRNQLVVLTGRLSPGEWATVGISNPDMERSNRGIPRDSRELIVSLFIHEADATQNHGLQQTLMVEVQQLKDKPEEFEFRAKFNAPPNRGHYVMDLHVQDMSNDTPKRGDSLDKIRGFAIFRREISVD